MNLRAIFLLITALQLQVGQGMALMGRDASSVPPEMEACHLSCCAGLTVEQGCCCLERRQSLPEPATPAPPPIQGKDLVPLIAWTTLAVVDVSAPVDAMFGVRAVHADLTRALRPQAVSLAVLHCAFLI